MFFVLQIPPHSEGRIGFNRYLIWSPVEEIPEDENSFLHPSPMLNIENGNFNRVPILGGFTAEEYNTGYKIFADCSQ